eukprot:TRINITY_DN10046_c0_g1_i1.p1 TRINITY_DN10046_c0_g1~~TRINITY_DN10046_c0_g1_i1.p1  ORF type:complete len:149 (+),score=33.05 TRINITY_DN10046_c0_g1_i1:173-619(+)
MCIRDSLPLQMSAPPRWFVGQSPQSPAPSWFNHGRDSAAAAVFSPAIMSSGGTISEVTSPSRTRRIIGLPGKCLEGDTADGATALSLYEPVAATRQFLVNNLPTNRERCFEPVSYTHLRAHETPEHLVCRLLLEKKKTKSRPTVVIVS